jgi:hypothetical protein
MNAAAPDGSHVRYGYSRRRAMVEDPLRALRAAGLGVLERVATASEIEPASLFDELCPFCSESTTSRIESVRSAEAVDAWLASQLATVPTKPTCFIVDFWTSAMAKREWLRVAPPADPAWLARLWRTEPVPGAILVMSPDAGRVLFVTDLYDGYLRAVALPTADVLAMRAERARLDRALAATPGLLRVPMRLSPRALHASELVATDPAYTLPLTSSDARCEAWLEDTFERWRAIPPRLDDRPTPEHIGPYVLSLAGTELLAAFGAYFETPSVVATVWRISGLDRLAIVDVDHTRALSVSREGDHYAARIVDLVMRGPGDAPERSPR